MRPQLLVGLAPLSLAIMLANRPAAVAQQSPAVQRWEYGDCTIESDNGGISHLSVELPGSRVLNMSDFFTNFGIQPPKDKPQALFLILNTLGTNGWELVPISSQGRLNGGGNGHFEFLLRRHTS